MKLSKHTKTWIGTVSLLVLAACNTTVSSEAEDASAKSDMIAEMSAAERITYSVEKARSTQGDGDPAIWRLADEDTTIYVFGTVHVLPDGIDWRTEKFDAAFGAADTLVLETDATSPESQKMMQQLVATYGTLGEGQTLSSLFSEEDLATVTQATGSVGLPFAALQQFKPWFVGLQMQVMQLMQSGYNIEAGVEKILTGDAAKAGMKMAYLETPEQQMQFLSGGSVEEQAENLVFAAEIIDMSQDTVDTLVAEWADGDVAGLGAIMGDPTVFGSEDVYNTLLVKRNQNWVPQIVSMLDQPGTKFVAVGAGHLAGPDSVINMLEAEGHKVDIYQ